MDIKEAKARVYDLSQKMELVRQEINELHQFINAQTNRKTPKEEGDKGLKKPG